MSDGLPVRAQVGGQPSLRFGNRLCHSPLGKAQKAERLWCARGVSRHQRRCAAGTGFEELRGVGVEAPGPGPWRSAAFCSPAPWLSRGGLRGLDCEQGLACGQGGPRCPGSCWGQTGGWGPAASEWTRGVAPGSPPGEAGPAATMFCPTIRPSVCRRLWFPGLGEGPGSPAWDADAVLPFLPRVSAGN